MRGAASIQQRLLRDHTNQEGRNDLTPAVSDVRDLIESLAIKTGNDHQGLALVLSDPHGVRKGRRDDVRLTRVQIVYPVVVYEQ